MFNRIRQAGRNALTDQKGAMGAFMGVGVIVFIGVAGLSVDTMRGYLVKSRLSSALDAAGLAGARVMFSATRDDDIRMFFESNFPPGYMGATVTYPNSPDPTILEPQVDVQNEVLTLTAEATIPTTLMRVLGFDTLTVSSSSEITRQTNLLDVMIAMDMSVSMDSTLGTGETRLEAAKLAALKLVDILYGTDGLAPLLNIGLVPWGTKVNITRNGEAFDPAATTSTTVPNFNNPVTGVSQNTVYFANNSPVPLLSAPPADWQGCVFARYTPTGSTNDADLILGPAWGVGGKDWPAWEIVGPADEPPACYSCTPCIDHARPLSSTRSMS